jgi:hypothetical protein
MPKPLVMTFSLGFDRNPKTNQTGLFVYLNTGNGFDNGKQWQSNLDRSLGFGQILDQVSRRH